MLGHARMVCMLCVTRAGPVYHLFRAPRRPPPVQTATREYRTGAHQVGATRMPG